MILSGEENRRSSDSTVIIMGSGVSPELVSTHGFWFVFLTKDMRRHVQQILLHLDNWRKAAGVGVRVGESIRNQPTLTGGSLTRIQRLSGIRTLQIILYCNVSHRYLKKKVSTATEKGNINHTVFAASPAYIVWVNSCRFPCRESVFRYAMGFLIPWHS